MPEPVRTSGLVRVRAASASDRGRVRDGNEDRVYVDEARGIFAVVDGVGGHASGEVAATIAVDVIAQRLSRPLWSPEQRVREAIALANNEILTQAGQSPQHAGMTCVLTVALLTERGLTVGHVGDTRLYKIDGNSIRKVTRDHSPVGEREDARELSEAEAMRHPRRNEVFRDVGSAFHEPDDDGFIDIVEEPFESDCALLVCSDGLTDMVSASAIERVIRQHAGDPARVAESLVLAANEAGGRDNVSVVYAEGEDFARSAPAVAAGPRAVAAPAAPKSDALRRFFLARGTWLVAGLLAGLGLGLWIAWTIALDPPVALGPRTLAVGQAADYKTIASALAAASPRDIVEVDAGDYQEALVVPSGVQLVARVPGTVTLHAPDQSRDAVAVTLADGSGTRLSGLRIVGTPQRPFAVGIRVAASDAHVDDVAIEANVAIGIDIVSDGDVTIRTSRFRDVEGVPVRAGAMARPLLEHDVFTHEPATRAPAIDIAAEAMPQLKNNVFVGYADAIKDAARREQELLQHNLIVGATPPAPRRGNR